MQGAAAPTWIASYGPSSAHPGSEAGSYLRLIDSCITQLKAQGPVTRVKKKKRRRSILLGLGRAHVDRVVWAQLRASC